MRSMKIRIDFSLSMSSKKKRISVTEKRTFIDIVEMEGEGGGIHMHGSENTWPRDVWN